MNKYNKLLYTAIFSVGIVLASPTFASYFDSYEFFQGEWRDNYIHFGGCENDPFCLDAQNNGWKGDTFFNIGDYNVKQGVYSVNEPTFYNDNSKLVLTYQYRFITKESSDNTTDKGYIKIKDVATNVIYYLKTLTPADANSDWQDIRVILPKEITNKKLQLVLEVENDDQRLSTMGINNISVVHKSKPEILGRIYEETSGKKFAVPGVTVLLKNAANNTILKQTITDELGNYTFYPVKAKRDFIVEVTYNDKTNSKNIAGIPYGSYSYGNDLVLE
ncbi:MAG: hypothetical protein WCW27_05215 [Patescibacteria group bacterium]|jgi:hypothetical protein